MGAGIQRTRQLIKQHGLIAIIRGDFRASELIDIAEVLIGNGIQAIEITLNTPDALKGITSLREQFQDVLVGAGTVRTVADAEAAVSAGAEFLVSPNLDLKSLAYSTSQETLHLPGVFTASEADLAYQTGCLMMKLFPSNVLGPAYLKALRAPLDNIDFVPTGGIDANNLKDYHKVGAAAFGIGAALVKNVRQTPTELSALSVRARTLTEALRKAREMEVAV
ncbi:MAG: bifunctional 4-hydroxy-2-oxoglutarate aldolase/2-dehydro-3-deoxy-phosphogluconate aldolase [Deinococcales bacterium]|nr:bifunctional 4-hydroxy-2-oxoglutarate aldolase/2-dehydro-3-deoxy-phosphogluconate aldolase [Deinococcales bacterium]